jgi:hypothetical protein
MRDAQTLAFLYTFSTWHPPCINKQGYDTLFVLIVVIETIICLEHGSQPFFILEFFFRNQI